MSIRVTDPPARSRAGGFFLVEHYPTQPDWTVVTSAGRLLVEPRKLFDLPEGVHAGAPYIPSVFDVTANGERFLMLKRAEDSSSTNRITSPKVLLVENWLEEHRNKK